MRRRLLTVLMLVLMAGLTLLPAAATATEVEQYKFQGLNAYAYLYTSDTNHEIYLGVQATQPKNGPATGYVFFQEYAYSSPPYDYNSFSGPIELPDGAFEIDQQLDTATLSFDQDVEGTHCDYDYGCAPMTFHLTFEFSWTGVGDMMRRVERSHSWGPEGKYQQRFNGTYRSAEVAGSWAGPATAGTFEGAYGELSNVKAGTLFVMH